MSIFFYYRPSSGYEVISHCDFVALTFDNYRNFRKHDVIICDSMLVVEMTPTVISHVSVVLPCNSRLNELRNIKSAAKTTYQRHSVFDNSG